MAEFILGSPLRGWARENATVRRALWRLDYVAVWSLRALLQRLPIDLSSRMGSRLGRLIGAAMRRKSELFKQNFAIALPDKTSTELDQLVTAAWSRAGRLLAEYPHMAAIGAAPERLQPELLAEFETMQNPEKPAVFVSAHQSNWEMVPSVLSRFKIPAASLYSPPTNPLLDRLLLDTRQAMNCRLLPRDNSSRHLLRAMKEGRSAAMIIDRRVDEGSPIPFFGHPKDTTLVPARLAIKFQCELIPVQVKRLQDANFRVIFHPPVKPRDPEQSETAQAEDMTAQVHEHFEQWIREAPEDWFCSKRLWAKGTMAQLEEHGSESDN